MAFLDTSGPEDTAESYEPFLKKQASRLPHSPTKRENALKSLLYAAGFVILVLSVWIVALSHRLSQCRNIKERDTFETGVYSPANEVLRYRNVVFESGFDLERTKYQGPPTPERNALWEDLYNFGITRIPRESAAKLVNKTVAIPDLLPDRQYAVQLDVFHQLHCLNMIRKRLYMTEADVAPDDQLMEMDHIEHCYDSLRQSLMCSVDVTPLTWQWVEKHQASKAVLQVMHTCRDYEAVKRWAMERRVAEFDLSVHVADDWI